MKTPPRILFVLSTFVSLALNFACAPGGSRSADGSVSAPRGPVVEGTVSGGGGNGCDGKAFEADSKRISEFEEYRLYVRPILRRMSEEGSDPLVTYLLWVAEEKAWFFIPCELKKLSSEQIGVSVDSDQLARHGEHGIYVHAIVDTPDRARDRETKHLPPLNTYYQKAAKDRAALLLHEMVMGARLLMKKPAKEQCTVLAKKDASLCADPEVMAIAEAREINPSQATVMDSDDHEAVRAMTTFLAEKSSDLSAESVKSTRERLGFHFPWSRAASSLDYFGVLDAFTRSSMVGDQYRVVGTAIRGEPNQGRSSLRSSKHPYFKDLPMTCSIAPFASANAYATLNIAFVTDIPVAGRTSIEQQDLKTKLESDFLGNSCRAFADRIYTPYLFNEQTRGYDSLPCPDSVEMVSAWSHRVNFQMTKDDVKPRGVLLDGVVYDEVVLTLIENQESARLQLGKMKLNAGELRILITREKAPRIHSLKFSPKQILKSAKSDERPTPELLDIPSAPPIECARIIK